jgi:Putative MetA-pathway of phenol degradation
MEVKVRTLFFVLFFVWTGQLFACDFCNCLMGINPYYSSSNALHVSMLFQHSTSPGVEEIAAPVLMRGVPGEVISPAAVTHGGAGASSETRKTIELAYRFHVSDDLMVTALAPYRMMQISGTESFSVNGFGDITVLAHYVMRPAFWEQTPVTLLLGGGVQLPTGSHTRTDPGGDLVEPDVQPGSGSVNYILSSTMTVQPGRWTFALDVYGKLNTRNSRQDKLGNSLAITAGVSRELMRDNSSLFAVVANAGLRGETASRDRVESVEDPETGTTSLYGNVGAQVSFGILRLDVGVLVPVSQERPAGAPDEETRLVSGLRLEL